MAIVPRIQGVTMQKPQRPNPIGARTTKLPSDVGVLAIA